MLNFSPLPDLRGSLPPLLEDLLTHEHNPIHRDIILTSVLPLLCACHPHVETYYDRKFYELALYTCVVGKSGIGKNRMEVVRTLGRGVHKYKESNITASGNTVGLFHPFNVSERQMANKLELDHSRGLYYATEIEGITDNMGKDWGKIRTPLRMAWHHEEIVLGRTDAEIAIDRPIINIILGGTKDQFRVLIPTTSKGLYSRFLLYHPHISGRDHIYDGGPTDEIYEQMRIEKRISDELVLRYKALMRRMHKGDTLQVLLPGKGGTGLWVHLREFWDTWYQRVQDHELTDMDSVVKRANVQTLRTASLFSSLRLDLDELEHRKSAPIDEQDYYGALALVNTFTEHSIGYALQEYKVHKHTRKPTVGVEGLLEKYKRMRFSDLAMEYTLGGKTPLDLEKDLGRLEEEGKCRRELVEGINWITQIN